MSYWEKPGVTDEWYTPQYIFDAMSVNFDMDVAHPKRDPITPSAIQITENSLDYYWSELVWMNPPFGGRNGILPWLEKFFRHGNGVALTPDRTSAQWYQYAINNCDGFLLVAGKVKFLKPDGSEGKNPSTGTTLWACGEAAVIALKTADKNGLGKYVEACS